MYFRLTCLLSNLSLCLFSVTTLPLLVMIAGYTNLYIPLTRLSAEILTPLEQEIKGMQSFRQPTKVTTV